MSAQGQGGELIDLLDTDAAIAGVTCGLVEQRFGRRIVHIDIEIVG